MNVGQKIKEVDLNYPVENITVNGKQFWPFYRVFFFDAQFVKGGTQTAFAIVDKIRFLFSSAYGLFKWFGKTDYLIFSNSDQRKEINGEWIDKSADYISANLPHCLHIELPVFTHVSHAKLKNKRVASHLPLRFAEVIYAWLFLKNITVNGLDTIDALNKKYAVQLSGKDLAKRFLAQYHIMKFVLRFKKPKMVFMVVPYMKMGYVLAAKEHGIKVVEMQHGSVNKSHFGYTNYKSFDRNLFPDFLFAYGEGVKGVFTDGNITYAPENVFPIGHYYLDLIQKNQHKQNALAKPLLKASRSIAVSLQDDSVGAQIVPILIEIANKKPDWLIVFVPRKTPQSQYQKMNLPSNIVFEPSLNVYEIIDICDIHTTVFSTCALEAPALGTPNVLINIANKSKEYFQNILSDTRVTRFADTANAYIAEIENSRFPGSHEIKDANKSVIISDFDKNLKLALDQLKVE